MNLNGRVARLERSVGQKPSFLERLADGRTVEELTDEELDYLVAQGFGLTLEQWQALDDVTQMRMLRESSEKLRAELQEGDDS